MSFFNSMHCGTSYCICSPPEVTFWVTRRSLEVISRITHKPVALNFKCTPSFATWWEVKWSKKYDGDIKEAHDRLFGQVFFNFLLKNEEFKN